MYWIGTLFALIMLVDWLIQKKEGAKLKTRMTVLLITVVFFITSEVVYKLKDRWNLPVLFRYMRESVLG